MQTDFARKRGLSGRNSFAVGRISLLLSDPSRTNRYNIKTNGSFMVSYWYPAEPRAGELPGVWEDKPLALDPNWWGGYNDRVVRFVTHSLPDAGISNANERYPVIIYVPGYSGPRAENQEKFEDLASHGYIVISADHWEVYGTVFPDGKYLHGSSVTGEPSTLLNDATFATKSFTRRTLDLRVILATSIGATRAFPGSVLTQTLIILVLLDFPLAAV